MQLSELVADLIITADQINQTELRRAWNHYRYSMIRHEGRKKPLVYMASYAWHLAGKPDKEYADNLGRLGDDV